MGSLDGRTAIVTGGGAGIGRAMAQAFVAAGARVLAVDVSSERLAETAAVVNADDSLACYVADITDEAAVQDMLADAERRFGQLDIICNNAGIADQMMTIEETSDKLWERVMAVNATAPFRICRAAVPRMVKAGGGVFVNTCSIASVQGGRGGFAYTASKHAILGLTRSIAVTYGDKGIRCNGIAPGSVKTDITSGMELSAVGLKLRERGLFTRPPQAEASDIAPIAVFLASDESRYINGACIVADSGWTAY